MATGNSYNLIGAPNNQSSWHTADYNSFFFFPSTWKISATSSTFLNLCGICSACKGLKVTHLVYFKSLYVQALVCFHRRISFQSSCYLALTYYQRVIYKDNSFIHLSFLIYSLADAHCNKNTITTAFKANQANLLPPCLYLMLKLFLFSSQCTSDIKSKWRARE